MSVPVNRGVPLINPFSLAFWFKLAMLYLNNKGFPLFQSVIYLLLMEFCFNIGIFLKHLKSLCYQLRPFQLSMLNMTLCLMWWQLRDVQIQNFHTQNRPNTMEVRLRTGPYQKRFENFGLSLDHTDNRAKSLSYEFTAHCNQWENTEMHWLLAARVKSPLVAHLQLLWRS